MHQHLDVVMEASDCWLVSSSENYECFGDYEFGLPSTTGWSNIYILKYSLKDLYVICLILIAGLVPSPALKPLKRSNEYTV